MPCCPGEGREGIGRRQGIDSSPVLSSNNRLLIAAQVGKRVWVYGERKKGSN